nr:MAG TPA: hypothetical protein [Caudoviricetes sp.]
MSAGNHNTSTEDCFVGGINRHYNTGQGNTKHYITPQNTTI